LFPISGIYDTTAEEERREMKCDRMNTRKMKFLVGKKVSEP